MKESVILVDENDSEIGTMLKMEAHVLGRLHRAFSVFIFNTKGELLLQQRATEKYHSGGKWTNTCCSHPRPGEDTALAAHRRLTEEMGMESDLYYAFNFTYQALVMDGIYEYEYDHVFFGISDLIPVPDTAEVSSFIYLDLKTLEIELNTNPENYSEWLKICFPMVKECYKNVLGL